MPLYILYYLTAIQTPNFGYINVPQMLPLLAISLILGWVSMSGKVWEEKLPPKTRNEFVAASFCLTLSPIVSFLFRKNERLQYEITVSLGYYS